MQPVQDLTIDTAVSATQYDEDITFYSNYGKDIDIAAPGGNTRVDQNGDGIYHTLPVRPTEEEPIYNNLPSKF